MKFFFKIITAGVADTVLSEAEGVIVNSCHKVFMPKV